jgi:glycyl-tRNA synthetase beta chain
LRARYLSIYSPQIVAAALAQAPDSPPLFAAKLAALKKFRNTKSAPPLANANKRINNILRKSAAGESLPPVDERAFQCEEERALYRAVCRLEKRSAGLAQKEQFAEALAMLAGASAPIDAFFEKVLVNSADAKIRRNRLSLLSRLRALLNQVADISQLAI